MPLKRNHIDKTTILISVMHRRLFMFKGSRGFLYDTITVLYTNSSRSDQMRASLYWLVGRSVGREEFDVRYLSRPYLLAIWPCCEDIVSWLIRVSMSRIAGLTMLMHHTLCSGYGRPARSNFAWLIAVWDYLSVCG